VGSIADLQDDIEPHAERLFSREAYEGPISEELRKYRETLSKIGCIGR